MSMTPEAYEEKMWRGLHNLQSALSRTKLGDNHYGYSSGHYNKFESLSDLLKISLLVIENVDGLPYSGGEKTVKEMMSLADELQHNAEQLSELSSRLKNEAQRWAERSWRASNID
ncbi:MAG: hypothetical protein O9296_16040 [Novosphingobium sp.]|nr:hypothetical protein [Novosphingobium sp.]